AELVCLLGAERVPGHVAAVWILLAHVGGAARALGLELVASGAFVVRAGRGRRSADRAAELLRLADADRVPGIGAAERIGAADGRRAGRAARLELGAHAALAVRAGRGRRGA